MIHTLPMYIFKSHTMSAQISHTLNVVPQDYQLSPSSRYYICKLLRQVPDQDSTHFLEFRKHLSADDCSRLNQALQAVYPDEAELTTIRVQIDNLVYLHRTLQSQLSLYPEYAEQLIQIKEQIFYLLGYRLT